MVVIISGLYLAYKLTGGKAYLGFVFQQGKGAVKLWNTSAYLQVHGEPPLPSHNTSSNNNGLLGGRGWRGSTEGQAGGAGSRGTGITSSAESKITSDFIY